MAVVQTLHRENRTRRAGRDQGWSLLEMAIVIAIILIASCVAFMSLQPTMRQDDVNTAYNTTMELMRRAHDQAIAQRRVYVVSFNAATIPNTVTVSQNALLPTGILLVSSTLPATVQFDAEAGIPTTPTTAPTTPDGFGTGKLALDFDQGVGGGGGTAIYFFPDGTSHDANGFLNSGVLYLARPGNLYSSRAVTLWGITGRIRGWRLYQNGGAGAYWRQQ